MNVSYSIPEIVMKELRGCNAWEVKAGGKHGKLFVNGVFCGAVSRGRGKDEPTFARNLRAQVRRALAR